MRPRKQRCSMLWAYSLSWDHLIISSHLAVGNGSGSRHGVARLQGSNGKLGIAGAILGALIDIGAAYDDVFVVHYHHFTVHLSAHGKILKSINRHT